MEFLEPKSRPMEMMEMIGDILPGICQIHDTRVKGDCLPKKKICPMKNYGWKTTFLLEWPIFRGHLFSLVQPTRMGTSGHLHQRLFETVLTFRKFLGE